MYRIVDLFLFAAEERKKINSFSNVDHTERNRGVYKKMGDKLMDCCQAFFNYRDFNSF
jgi:hypothetical protein